MQCPLQQSTLLICTANLPAGDMLQLTNIAVLVASWYFQLQNAIVLLHTEHATGVKACIKKL